ncbi:MAG TPA: T6SS effector BTH_I2691 family protein, partial [Pseudomonas sp.]|uniref:T6SS effector BTH_I2691 family protein n=1 Tax=Pseudomonas sp. TaxID=306 RepID=UPI002B4967FA
TNNTSEVVGILTRQNLLCTNGGCKVCERTGLPIMLLRNAYAPAPGTLRKQPGARALPMRLEQARTLRHGYVYVVLDLQEWQAYEVTPEGALRQFPPYQPPLAAPPSLSRCCVAADHDIPAAFINIDTQMFSNAWIAFSNDPWSKEVLDRYLTGCGSDGVDTSDRFTWIDLKAAREDPASIGRAMTGQDLQLHDVLEYTEGAAGDFTSAHGFYSRNQRLTAMRGHVRTLIQREQLEHGILALTLPDPIGVVQEANAQRAACFTALQEWRAEPQRRFEMFTSQALLGIRQLQDAWAAAQAAEEAEKHEQDTERWNSSPISAKVTLPAVDLGAETERRTSIKQQEARERLEERYDEAARAAFEQEYLREQAAWQKTVDAIGELYAQQFDSAIFKLATRYDYDTAWPRGTENFIRMIAPCLSGGPSEAPPLDGAALGATQRLWQDLLEDRDSLLYQALLARDQGLVQQLASALTGDDLGRVYATLRTTITSQEGQRLWVAPVREAIGQLLAATANASNVLVRQLGSQTQALVGHLHSAALLRYTGQHVTQIVVSLRLGEYLSLLNEALQERTDAFLSQLDEQFRKPAQRKVRAMVLSGAIAIAVPSNHGKLVNVALWSLESAEALQARLEKLRVSASAGVADAVRAVSIGTASLQGGAAHRIHNLGISAAHARELAKEALQGMRKPLGGLGPGKFDLLLSLGSLWFQQDSLRKSYEALANASEGEKPEALAAVWSTSVGVMGFGIEIAGFTTKVLRPDLTTLIQIKGQVQTVGRGARIAQYGGAIVAITAIADGVQYAFAARRASHNSDGTSAGIYGAASFISLAGAVTGVAGVMAPQAILLGPLGIAIILGLAAFATATWAKRMESTRLELWVRACKWGTPKTPHQWISAIHFDTAIGALNAAALGMTAEADIVVRLVTDPTHGSTDPMSAVLADAASVSARAYLTYTLKLPHYQPDISKYTWTLRVFRSSERHSQTIASSHDYSSVFPQTQQRHIDYDPKTVETTIELDTSSAQLNIGGSIALISNHRIHALELEISYWPDSSDEAGHARLLVKKDKMDSAGWGKK